MLAPIKLQCNIVSPSLVEKFVNVCNCVNNICLGLQSATRDGKELGAKNCAMKKTKCEI